jgi:phospholipid/cholesterol/gamma-HCH transport system permease protein
MNAPASAQSRSVAQILWEPFASLGANTIAFLSTFGAISRLAGHMFKVGLRRPFEGRELVRQLHALGVQSISIAFLTALFTGAVMALQFGWSLERFGAASYVGKVVSVGFVMELGPVLTALLVGGRVGAGITAELGSMSVTEQIDAIRALGADPVKRLVWPRVMACTISMPILALMADFVGTAGGMMVAVFEQGLTASYYIDQVLTTVDIGEVAHGLIKALFFGFAFGIIGCYQGLQTRGGTEGVGRATTRTVVMTSITILVSDFVLGKALLPFVG